MLIVYAGAGAECYGRIGSIAADGAITLGTETVLFEQIINTAVGAKFVALAYSDDDDAAKGKLIIMRP